MLILTLRTDKPEAELGLFDGANQLSYQTWLAHRELAETLHGKIDEILQQNSLNLKDLSAVAVYKGPGSFTGLRIGIAIANAFANSLGIQIVGEEGEDWLTTSIQKLETGENDKIVVPEYGALPNITPARK